MRILVTGATGFIGQAVVAALVRAGHTVVCASRHPRADAPQREPLAVDFAAVPPPQWWLPRLAGVDAVVNAVGILREQPGQTFTALHEQAPIALFRACAQAGVPFVLQISALGADEAARSRYHRSKKAADDALRQLPLQSAIVQPSLVYGPGGASAAMFNGMAVLPLLALPAGGAMQVQPVHVDDVVAGVLALLQSPPPQPATIAFVGPEPMPLREFLAALRRQLGLASPLRVLPLPAGLFRFGASLAGHIPGSFLDSETAGMLLRGNVAPAGPFTRLLGRPPLAVASFIERARAATWRQEAMLGTWLPLLRWSIALLWIWTGIVSLGLYPVSDSLELLARVGLRGGLATLALYGAAALDLLLGVATIIAPPARRRLVWAGQLLLVLGYTALITIFLPEYWLHPYGPLSKNLPLAAAIALLWALEPPRNRAG
ncbi:SDR family oxidoreductase [Ramlibacter sp.]|uniref:SDR family oxidoreductase n=1 Tax=Ramlibacter sp. TaxID=1917967 RepID=UPI002BA3CDD8|nr:SDR family oxidoreductase [Ramlibacter sp.]HWI84113.1 SDR family oxidoreductase [Ramlibacter sp.]